MESEIYLAKMENELNSVVLHGVVASGETIKLGKMYAAKYIEDTKYYRCQVISIGPQMSQVNENTHSYVGLTFCIRIPRRLTFCLI